MKSFWLAFGFWLAVLFPAAAQVVPCPPEMSQAECRLIYGPKAATPEVVTPTETPKTGGFEIIIRHLPKAPKVVPKTVTKPVITKPVKVVPAPRKIPPKIVIAKPVTPKPLLTKPAKLIDPYAGLPVMETITLSDVDMLPIAGQFIIRFRPDALAAAGITMATITPETLAARFGMEPYQVLSIQRIELPGFVANLTDKQRATIAADPLILRVTPDTKIKAAGGSDLPVTQVSQIPWGLDRIDQAALPLDGAFNRRASRAKSRIYLLDNGVDMAHPELESRVKFGATFLKVVPNDIYTTCRAHGTAMASIMTGKTLGVLPDAEIYDVTVLPCDSNKTGAASSLVEAFEWIIKREQKYTDHAKIIINLSLIGPKAQDINDWINLLVDKYKVIVVVAAGNQSKNACDYSPASAQRAITVAASDKDDKLAKLSNNGACVDMLSPGTLIPVAQALNYQKPILWGGTSQAAAFVSAALARDLDPAQEIEAITTTLYERSQNAKLDLPDSDAKRLLLLDSSAK